MRLTILAIGRLRGGPEAALCADYLARLEATGRKAALGPARLAEIEDRRRRGAAGETGLLLDAVPAGAKRVVLDERGEALSTRAFAKRLAAWRDQGVSETAFLIGGADGHAREARESADLILSFGPMIWPHRLARVMLAEQLFRAASILANSPYHRD